VWWAVTDINGKTHKLSDYKGKIVVLFLNPKSQTPNPKQIPSSKIQEEARASVSEESEEW